MIKNIAIVSLSRGIVGEPFMRFEVEIGLHRLKELGLDVKFMPHALKGLEYVEAHPEKRAEDLLQAFLPDICELGPEILPYTRKYFEELIRTGTIREIRPSDVWYEQRDTFTPEQVGKQLPVHPDHGFELLQGPPVFSGKILGGCIDSIYDIFDGERYFDMPVLCEKYHLFPAQEDWKGRILLLESSEEKPTPAKFRRALEYLKGAGVFEAVSGVLVGKPMDNTYADEYRELLIDVIDCPELPVVFNVNIGHAMPRCIIPFGADAVVDVENQVIRFS